MALIGNCKMPRLNYFLNRKRMNSTVTIHITRYQRVVDALNEIIRLLGGINSIIKTHGGWPGVFQLTNEERGSTE